MHAVLSYLEPYVTPIRVRLVQFTNDEWDVI